MKSNQHKYGHKQKVLFLTRTLGRAGVGVSLMPVLKSLDYTKFNVTLGVQYPYKELEDQVPGEVKIVYYGEITSPVYKRIFNFNSALAKNRKNAFQTFLWHLLNKLEDLRMAYKVCKCFRGKWDTANAYHQGVASWYVMKLVKAKKRVLWYHASVIEQPWYKKIFSKADQIVTDSENARQVMLDAWGQSMASKIKAMNCLIPIDEITLKSQECVEFCNNSNSTLIFSCGRLGEEKGMDLAVKAAAIVKEKCPDLDFSWIIVGDGAERQKIENIIIEEDLRDCVQLLGYKANPYPYFSLCDIYVQPSRLECFGITMAEALALHKPVITTATPGGRENVRDGENGLVTEINAEGIAQAVIRLLTDSSLLTRIKENVEKTDYSTKLEESVKFINEVECCQTK